MFTISLDKGAILKNVRMQSSYQAAKTGDAFDAERVKEADGVLTDAYFKEAEDKVIQMLLSYITSTSSSGITVEIKDFPDALKDSLQSTINSMMTYYCLWRWHAMLQGKVVQTGENDAASVTSGLYAEAENHVRRILMMRTRPYKLTTQPM